jgi:hypothetical protein
MASQPNICSENVCDVHYFENMNDLFLGYLRMLFRSDLSWVDQLNYMVRKAWKALHFTMGILKKGNSSTKCLAYTSLVRPIQEACWDPYREEQINALDRVQTKAAKLAHHRNHLN